MKLYVNNLFNFYQTPEEFLEVIRKNFLTQHIRNPTRSRGTNKPSILDLVLSDENFISGIDYLSSLGKSDHSVMRFSCNFASTDKCIGAIKDKDNIISEDDKKASAFCRYFCSVFTIVDNSYLELNLADPDPSSSVIEFGELDLNKALGHINVYKLPGPDGIHPRILYETRNIITAPLKKVFETSLLLKELRLANGKYFSHI